MYNKFHKSILLGLLVIVSTVKGQNLLKFNNTNKRISKEEIVNIEKPKEFNISIIKLDTTTLEAKGMKGLKSIELDSIANEVLTTNLNKQQKELDDINKKTEIEKRKFQKKIDSLKKSIDELRNSIKQNTDEYNKKRKEFEQFKDDLNKENFDLLSQLYTKDSADANKQIEDADSNITSINKDITNKRENFQAVLKSLNNIKLDTTINKDIIELSEKVGSLRELLKPLRFKIDDLRTNIKEFNTIGVLISMDRNDISSEIVKARIKSIKLKLLSNIKEFQESEKKFAKDYNVYIIDYDKIIDKITKIQKEAKNEITDASLLANFTQPLNNSGSLIPQLNVFASKASNMDDLGILAQAKLFLAGTGSDTSSLNAATKFFIPEASQLGFMADITFGFIRANPSASKNEKKLGISFGFYYLQKQLLNKEASKSSSPFSIGAIQLRTGFEYTLIPQMLAIYGKMNGITVGKGLAEFKNQYTGSDKMEWYSEFGLLSYLNLSSDKTLNILLDLRFIPVNSYIKTVTQSTDPFISLFKLGIVKDFSF